eukprot:PhF_6_TR8835/c0_g1_i1/m.14007
MTSLSPVEKFYAEGCQGLTDRFHNDAKGEVPSRPLNRSGAPIPLCGGDYVYHEYANQFRYRELRELASKYNLLHNYGKVVEVKSYPDGSESVRYETVVSVDPVSGAPVMSIAQCPNTDKNLVLGTSVGYQLFHDRRIVILQTFTLLKGEMVRHIVENMWRPCRYHYNRTDITLHDPTMKETVRLIQCASCGLALLVDLAMPRYLERPHLVISSLPKAFWEEHNQEKQEQQGLIPLEDFTYDDLELRREVHPVEVETLLKLGKITSRDADVLRFWYELQPYSWPMAWENVTRANPPKKT